jgi:hypothetical protein
MRSSMIAIALSLVLSVALGAHHSYTAFDRNRTVTVAGTVEDVRFANPHVVMTLRPSQAPALTVTWQSLYQLAGAGVTAEMVSVGAQLTISGSPALDPARRELTLIRMVENATDGWRWEGGRLSRVNASERQD